MDKNMYSFPCINCKVGLLFETNPEVLFKSHCDLVVSVPNSKQRSLETKQAKNHLNCWRLLAYLVILSPEIAVVIFNNGGILISFYKDAFPFTHTEFAYLQL